VLALEAQAKAAGLAPRGVGVSLCEIVGRQGGIASRSLADWVAVPFPDRFEPGLPVWLVADVRAAALGELRFGALRGVSEAIFVSIGTGLSACPVIGGMPHAGAHGAALVLASARLPRPCPSCGAVAAFCLEEVASGRGIETAYAAGRPLSATEILQRAAQGEHHAAAVVAAGAREAGTAIGQLANCLDPEAVVVGGGLGSAPGPYWQALAAAFRAALWPDLPRPPAILRAQLGADAGLIGSALALAEGVH
jgi:glucokinase